LTFAIDSLQKLINFILCVNMLVMKDGLVIQSGMYNELLASCSDFAALVAAHHSSMEITGEYVCHVQNTLSSQPIKSDNGNGETTVGNEYRTWLKQGNQWPFLTSFFLA
jgi:Tfp pilus tip-associated adhesin PilY1